VSARDVLGFAARALRGHRLRSGLSLLGVSIGVAAVIALTALGEGARRYVVGQFASIGTNLVIVLPGKTDTTGGMPGIGGVPHDLTIEDVRVLVRTVREIEKAAPISMGTEAVAHDERRRQVALAGATSEMLEVRHLAMERGEFLPPMEWDRGSPVAVLGAKTARELFPGGEDPVGRVVRIADFRMHVIGVLAPRGMQLGIDMDDVAIVPVATAMRMLNRPSLFRVLLQVRSHADLDAAKQKVTKVLAERHGEEDVTVITQDAVLTAFTSILGALTMALGGIAAISLAVAGVGIMNVMLVSVSERTREIGLLKALGAGRGQILAVFLAEAVLLSTLGGLIGLAIGWAAVRVLVAVFPRLRRTGRWPRLSRSRWRSGPSSACSPPAGPPASTPWRPSRGGEAWRTSSASPWARCGPTAFARSSRCSGSRSEWLRSFSSPRSARALASTWCRSSRSSGPTSWP
jgi:putative ABC transport system permease protein